MKKVSWLVLGLVLVFGCESDDEVSPINGFRLKKVNGFSHTDSFQTDLWELEYEGNTVIVNASYFDSNDNTVCNDFFRIERHSDGRIKAADFKFETGDTTRSKHIYDQSKRLTAVIFEGYQISKINGDTIINEIQNYTWTYDNQNRVVRSTSQRILPKTNTTEQFFTSVFVYPSERVIEEYTDKGCLTWVYEQSKFETPSNILWFFSANTNHPFLIDRLITKKSQFACDNQQKFEYNESKFSFDSNNNLIRIDETSDGQNSSYGVLEYEQF